MKKLDKDILKEYKPAEEYIIVNDNDYDLVPIKILMPKAPEIELIGNYGIEAKEQVFQREVYPDKLYHLERKIKKQIKDREKRDATNEDFWKYLFNNQYENRDIIKWIKLQWYKRLNGDWQFINGTPTYLPANLWFYVNWWHHSEGKIEFRDSQRRRYLAYNYFKTVTKDFTGKEWNRRLVTGVNEPKGRRYGVSGQVACDIIEYHTRTYNSFGGLQSINEESADDIFEKHYILYGFIKLPFFFKPNYYFSDGIKFGKRTSRIGNKLDEDLGLCSEFSSKPATINAFQGGKLHRLHNDEIANTDEYDILQRYEQQKQVLVLGDKIIGFCYNTSNVEDSSSLGGRRFEELCRASFIDKINDNGMTQSGLANYFNPATQGMEGFIGKYGESVIDTPDAQQKEFLKKDYGSLAFIKNTRIDLEKKEDWEKLANFKRKYPLTFRECFSSIGSGMGFNTVKLNERKSDIRTNGDKRVWGDLRWRDGIIDGEVEWIPSNANEGKYIMSELPTPDRRNLKYSYNGYYCPSYPHIWSGGADPYKNNEALRGSKGGGAIFKCRDFNKDNDIKDVRFWTSYNFNMTYLFRPETLELYCEDMLMMSVFYGALMYPEANVEAVESHFKARGYKGFLNYDIDTKTGLLKEKAGGLTLQNSDELFNIMVDYMNVHSCHENHIEMIEECEIIRGTKDMKRRDRFVAGVYAIKGATNKFKLKNELERSAKSTKRVHLFPVNTF